MNRLNAPALCAVLLAVSPALAQNAAFDADAVNARCAAEWPGDHRMTKYCIDQDETGFDAFERLRAPLTGPLGISVDECLVEWPHQWTMVTYCAEQRLNGAAEAQGILEQLPAEAGDKIMEMCLTEWRYDFSMVAYCMKQQADAWEALN